MKRMIDLLSYSFNMIDFLFMSFHKEVICFIFNYIYFGRHKYSF